MIHQLGALVLLAVCGGHLLPGTSAGECTPRTTEATLCDGASCVNGDCESKTVDIFGTAHTRSMCKCDPYWAGQYCDKCCELECGDHGVCRVALETGPECFCDDGWMGRDCDLPDIPAENRSGLLLFVLTTEPSTSFPIEATSCSAVHNNFTDHCYDKDCYHGFCDRYTQASESGTIRYGDCKCNKGWKGHECTMCCDLDCGEFGECEFLNGNSSHPLCNCENNMTGAVCREPVTMPPMPTGETIIPDSYKYIIAGAVVGLIIVVSAGISLVIWMYHKRYILIMKMVFKLRKYEDNDGKWFDAFISYRTSNDEDRQFVVKQLFPMLEEQMGFKLCIDQKDFIPGEVIANNVIDAITNSRATILLLSPSFCDSEWTQFEYQRAQLESISKHHRIIPIMFRDVSRVEKMDVNLQHIIRTITYLEWPGDSAEEKEINKFWEKLALSMPKLKPVKPATQVTEADAISHL